MTSVSSDAGFLELLGGIAAGGILALGAIVCLVACIFLYPEGGKQ